MSNQFRTSDHASYSGTSGHFWRGYYFEVREEIQITSLIGSRSSSSGTFKMGIYEASGLESVTKLLRWTHVPSGRNKSREIDPVVLEPYRGYFIAQGRESGTANHYYSRDISTDSIFDSPHPISSWGPGSGRSVRWSNGDQYHIVNRSIRSYSTVAPDIGFIYGDLAKGFTAVKVSGIMRDIDNSYCKISGNYRKVDSSWVKVNGVWRESN